MYGIALCFPRDAILREIGERTLPQKLRRGMAHMPSCGLLPLQEESFLLYASLFVPSSVSLEEENGEPLAH